MKDSKAKMNKGLERKANSNGYHFSEYKSDLNIFNASRNFLEKHIVELNALYGAELLKMKETI